MLKHPLLLSLLVAMVSFLPALILRQADVNAQTITHGPIISAVTENAARVYVRTSTATAIDVVLSTDSLFTSPTTFSGATNAADDSSGITDLTGLLADTKYFYKAVIAGSDTSNVQSFMTFPLPGTVSNFHFAFGSCQGFNTVPPTNDPIFDQILLDKPRFFLQCGDWGYPDSTDNMPFDSSFFAADPQRIIETYRARYSGAQIKNLMSQVAIDYIYDDHDYVNDNTSRTSSSYYDTILPFRELSFPASTRRNSIDAYSRFFPHYDLVDTSEGIYHSFRYGNIEVFMCDNRSARSPNLDALVWQDTAYFFITPPGHSILGQQQLLWLMNGLKNSTAMWKFVITGVAFNIGYRDLINAISGDSSIQAVDLFGMGTVRSALGGIIDTWSGFPADQDTLLNYCKQNNIRNVIWLSSDSHTSAIDDGTNAGFPEIMAGNLAKPNSQVAFFMANASTLVPEVNQDFEVWNAGGQGLGNLNFNDAYGRIDVYGDDSVKLSIIDVNGVLIADLVLYDSSVVGIVSKRK
ncbi:MAG: alkaline phosphatase D family protein, partial [Bacteroidetes bacterium]|nr:alkaline phosphatase D family protein [Bacteroidota bacterium]